MSRFSGPQPGYKDPRTRAKGVERRYKEQKKLEAEVRDELLAPDDPKRRAVRLSTLPEPDVTTRKRQRTRRKNETLVVSHNFSADVTDLDLDNQDSDRNMDLECNCGASMVDGGMSSAHLDWCNLTPILN